MVDEEGAELARMREAEAKRKSRSKLIGGVAAGVVLLGGGVLVGSTLGDGETEPGAEQTPPVSTASAGVQPSAPVEIDPPSPAGGEVVDPTASDTEPAAVDFRFATERVPYFHDGGDISQMRAFYAGLDHDWILGSAPEAGRNYVENFLVERGASTPLAHHADLIDREDNTWLADLETPGGGTESVEIAVAAGENITAVLNVYLVNKDELGIDIDRVMPESQRIFDAMGTYLIRGMAETGEDRTLCEDEFDCPSALDHAGLRQMIATADALPADSVVLGAQINFFPDERNRHDDITLHYIDGATSELLTAEFSVDNRFMLYPLEVPFTSDSMANAINQNYLGAPNGDGDIAQIYMENEDAIHDKIGNRPLN
ncbi:hypothetical protein [Ornithinimicrobium avium]|nr:hypothetical protein [Ornithinimicrobium avium]